MAFVEGEIQKMAQGSEVKTMTRITLKLKESVTEIVPISNRKGCTVELVTVRRTGFFLPADHSEKPNDENEAD